MHHFHNFLEMHSVTCGALATKIVVFSVSQDITNANCVPSVHIHQVINMLSRPFTRISCIPEATLLTGISRILQEVVRLTVVLTRKFIFFPGRGFSLLWNFL